MCHHPDYVYIYMCRKWWAHISVQVIVQAKFSTKYMSNHLDVQCKEKKPINTDRKSICIVIDVTKVLELSINITRSLYEYYIRLWTDDKE